jgi:hypothetical protein
MRRGQGEKEGEWVGGRVGVGGRAGGQEGERREVWAGIRRLRPQKISKNNIQEIPLSLASLPCLQQIIVRTLTPPSPLSSLLFALPSFTLLALQP